MLFQNFKDTEQWFQILFEATFKLKTLQMFIVKVEIFLEQREFAFSSPSKICEN